MNMTGCGGFIENSLQEVDEDDVSNAGTSSFISPLLPHLQVTPDADLAPELPPSSFFGLPSAGSSSMMLGAQGPRRKSEAFKDLNQELQNLLDSSFSHEETDPDRTSTSFLNDHNEGHSDEDESEDILHSSTGDADDSDTGRDPIAQDRSRESHASDFLISNGDPVPKKSSRSASTTEILTTNLSLNSSFVLDETSAKTSSSSQLSEIKSKSKNIGILRKAQSLSKRALNKSDNKEVIDVEEATSSKTHASLISQNSVCRVFLGLLFLFLDRSS